MRLSPAKIRGSALPALGISHVVGGVGEPVGDFRHSQLEIIYQFHPLHQAMVLIADFVFPASEAASAVDSTFPVPDGWHSEPHPVPELE